ncbi:MAG TPA: hypothetical protein VGM30_22910 [Puia sp.]|jgi:hypothetical protein
MTNANTPADVLNWQDEPKKIPDMLNVLSILTYIWCGISAISVCYSFFNAQASYDKIVQMQGKLDEAPAIVKKFMGPDMVEIARKSVENRIPILLLSVVGIALCAYGVTQMRHFKKTGFSLYVIGELLPIATAIIFVSLGSLGGLGILSSFLIPVVFIILYATQLKYLK